LSRKLGSRHRAAIGISEETDCVALVVSEETGNISIVFDGQLSRGLDPPALAERLRELLSLDDLAVENEEIKIAEKIPEAQPAAGMGK
jgi:diadenylate cyclase